MFNKIDKNLVLKDLKNSGLSERDYNNMKIKLLPNKAQIIKALNIPKDIYDFENGGYLLPYFNIDGSINKDCYNVRLYPIPALNIRTQKIKKYLKPKGVINSVYLPPIIDWATVAKDPSIPIYITEGEKKAYKGCKHNFTMLALPGVNGFKNWYEFDLLPILKQINWVGRKVIVVYDNDVQIKSEVAQAINQLSAYLLAEGARPLLKNIPYDPEDEEKLGVDDYITKYSAKKFDEIPNIELSCSKKLHNELNKNFCYIQQMSQVYKPETDSLFQPNSLEQYYGNNQDVVPVIVGSKPIKIANYWTKWKAKTNYINFVFDPTTTERDVERFYNKWEGLNIEPKKGDVNPFLNFIDHIFQNESEENKKWFIQWCAYPLQHLGTKLYTGVLFHGMQGTGKSFLGNILRNLYGRYGGRISNSNITSTYTSWIEEKLFLQGDEVNGSNNREHDNKFKDYITGADIEVNKKYVPQYIIRNYANFFFTSNNWDAFYIEPKERRFFIVEVPKELPEALRKRLDKWQHDGIPYLLDYLLKVNLKDFNPKGKAPASVAKKAMMEMTRSEIDEFIHSIIDNPKHVLTKSGQFKSKDWFSIDEIKFLHNPTQSPRVANVTTAKFKKVMRKFDFDLSHTIRHNHQTLVVYCLQNLGRWRKNLDGSKIRTNFESEEIAKVNRLRR